MRGRLYTGAQILTMDPRLPTARALAVHAGTIVGAGDEAECAAALERACGRFDRVELEGGCILPGFIDTHMHPIAMIYFEENVDLRGARDVGEVIARLRDASSRVHGDGWIVGLSLDDALLEERRLPTRHELDAVSPERCVVVLKRDGHTAVGNTRALAAAGLARGTPDPEGGHVVRDASGEPLGACHEGAARRLLGAMPAPDLDAYRGSAQRVFRRIVSHGITSAGVVLQTDAEGPGGEAGALEALALTLLAGEVPFSLYAILMGRDPSAVAAAREGPLHAPESGRRVGGYKMFADGTLGACTACMSEPFADHGDRSGYMTIDDRELYERMERAHLTGLQVCVHAIGDEANRRTIETFEALLARHPRADHRHRLEHASLLPPPLIARIARLGLAVSTQPLFIASERAWLHARLGPERARHAYPLRDLLDARVLVGGASDAPIESTDVLRAIECCVTRDGFETQQSITADEALAMFTIDAARLQHEEHEKGSLALGKRADFVWLSESPLAVAPERISRIEVRATVVAGRAVHGADLVEEQHG